MDVFQGWYKDGTEGTVDYRFLSAFFLILRIAHGGKIIAISLIDNKTMKKKCMLIQVLFVGVLQILIGSLFFVLKPYKKIWMSNVDAIIFTLAGCYMLIETLNNRLLFISVTIVIILVVVLILICVFYKNLWKTRTNTVYSVCKSLLLLNIHLLFCKLIIAIIVFSHE